MSEDDERFDDLFTHIAGQSGGIKPLLDSFFGFLHRKTDFYVQFDLSTDEPDSKKKQFSMGFPKGVAEKMLVQSFRKYPMKDFTALPAPPDPVGKDIRVGSATSSSSSTVNFASASDKAFSQGNNQTTHESNRVPCSLDVGAGSSAAGGTKNRNESGSHNKSGGAKTSTGGDRLSTVQYTEKGTQLPVGNGGVADNYYWTQTLKDLTVYIDVPPDIASSGVKGKDIKCTLGPRRLFLMIKDKVHIQL